METSDIKIMIFGTFDYLHAGHENLFIQAKKLIPRSKKPFVVAVVALDRTVQQIKGQSPDNDITSRVENLQETHWANTVVEGDKKDKYKAIKKFRPDIIALGYDQFAFTHQLEKLIIDLHLDTKVVRLKPYRPSIYKSSLIRKHVLSKPPHPGKKSHLSRPAKPLAK